MECKVTYLETFIKPYKRLKKRYPSLNDDLKLFIEELKTSPESGTPLGHKLRKVRMAIASKGKGKSGGARIITYVVILEQTSTSVMLLTIYDKSDCENISDNELKALMRKNNLID